jgi:hypothetical protein
VTRLVFRSATDRDIEQILVLWNAAVGVETVTDTREGVLGLLDADPGALLVAESDDGEIVGSAPASPGRHQEDGRSRIVSSACRSLRLARLIARAISGALILAKPYQAIALSGSAA